MDRGCFLPIPPGPAQTVTVGPSEFDTANLGIVVSLSTMMLLGLVSPLPEPGARPIRSSGISVGSPVSGQMVIESVASKRSSCTTSTGHGLPV